MSFSFKAKIYKTGINWAVDVPEKISAKLEKTKGYIRIKGKINNFDFKTNLVPVKGAPHRLFVNGMMMKGGHTALGRIASFEIEQNPTKVEEEFPVPPQLKKALKENKLEAEFKNLSPTRIKDILRDLYYIKTEETLQKNIAKVIKQLKEKIETPESLKIMKHIISQMRQTRATALNMASQYSMEQLNKVPQGFNNNMIWNLGHMVATVQGVCYGRSNVPMTVSTEYFDLYKPGSKPERDITQAEFEEIKRLMFSTLDQFEKDYDKKIFEGFTPFLTRTGVQLNSLEEAVKFLHFHDGIHFGVIMSQRKLV